MTTLLLLLALSPFVSPALAGKGAGGVLSVAPTGSVDACSPAADKIPLLAGPELPRAPQEPRNLIPDDQKIEASEEQDLKFPATCEGKGISADASKHCRETLAKIVRYYRGARSQVLETKKNVCADIQKVNSDCAGQADALKCAGEVHGKAGKALQQLGEDLKKQAAELQKIAMTDRDAAEAARKSFKAADRSIEDRQKKIASGMIAKINASDLPPAKERIALPGSCISGPIGADTQFCLRATVAEEASHFAKILAGASLSLADTGKKLTDRGAQLGAQAGNEKTAGNGDEKKGSGFGMDDAMKLATVGLTGATAICAITKKCSPQKEEQQSDISGKDNPGQSQATAPTPNGTNTENSPVVDAGKNGSSGSSSTGSDTKTSGDAIPAFHSGGGGGREATSDRFAGGLDGTRGLASTPATAAVAGGGGMGAGSGGASLGGSSESAPTPGKAPAESSGTAGGGSGGMAGLGGLGSATGFSLGDPHTATPTDNALKSILNGDGLPASADPALDPLGNAAGAAGGQAGDASFEDPDSIFLRVRGVHVRCLKRGCVGAGVGTNI
jgi:hypothetical protein